jgi:Flp pilus assembly protein TadB
LERVSESIRELSRLQKKIVTETAEVRSQEKVILFMTPIFGFLVCLFDPSIPDILFNSFVGNMMLVMVVGMQVFAVVWIRRIVNSTI